MFEEQVRIVDSLRRFSDLSDAAWVEVRKEISAHGLEGASQTARVQVATAMLKARVTKGDYVGHPFRGNQWTDASGVSQGGSASSVVAEARDRKTPAKVMLADRAKPIKVKDISKAIKLMQEGKVVELDNAEKVNTLLKELHDLAQEAKDRGEKFKINLCNVSVSGTNLFCGASLAGEDGKPLPRIKMPQLSGTAREGSAAAKIADKDGQADAGPAFLKFLKENGVDTTEEKVEASSLKASQAELIGAKVAAIMTKETYDKGVIYVSRDNYVIDGHRRWAGAVGADAEDGLGDLKIKVVRVDMPITEVLKVSNAFTEEFGIERQEA